MIRFNEVPAIETILIDRPDQPPLGAGEPAIGTDGRRHRQRGLRCHRRQVSHAAAHAGAGQSGADRLTRLPRPTGRRPGVTPLFDGVTSLSLAGAPGREHNRQPGALRLEHPSLTGRPMRVVLTFLDQRNDLGVEPVLRELPDRAV